ncbi:hypothetical protein EJ03DRAFT_324987 [Teratosphaeria nubilosa]|uniref:Uncharacterized protein n=1 Tax=Teratosphaeria nubilosa TaxID=161662 RepID=A0A6G1LJ08_9PEZI|nr:hypothetical protein EJ03DRAFT_324987 [Teratosphaeria nubilosa]
MTADQLCQYLTTLGWRAGYGEKLATYPFRRGFWKISSIGTSPQHNEGAKRDIRAMTL